MTKQFEGEVHVKTCHIRTELSKNGLNIDFRNVLCHRGQTLLLPKTKSIFLVYTTRYSD